MKPLALLFAAVATLIFATPDASAQQRRASPHETLSSVIEGNRVTITYGRPFTKDPRSGEDRTVWGGLVPFGKAWRMGADEATTLITQQPLAFGETTLPAGAYTLYFVPAEDGTAKLAFSSNLGGWGVPVNESKDVARVDAAKSELTESVDQFTIAIEKGEAANGTIKISWEKTAYAVPFTLKK